MARLSIRTPDGTEWPLAVDIDGYRRITGDNRTARGVRFDLASGRLPSLPRQPGKQWQIPTARLLDQLGVAYTVGAAKE